MHLIICNNHCSKIYTFENKKVQTSNNRESIYMLLANRIENTSGLLNNEFKTCFT